MREVNPSEVTGVYGKPTEVNRTQTASSDDDLRTFKLVGGEEEDEKTYIQNGPAGEIFIPPDGSWAWVVVFGCFVISVAIQMMITGFGVLFSGFLLSLDTSSTMTSWIFCVYLSLWNAMGLFVKPFLQVFGWRPVSITAGLLNSVALIFTAFSPSAEFLFFSFSLLSGLASGILVYICFIILPNYFYHRRGVANALMMAGISVGQFSGPLIFRYLLDKYGFQGATLIIGALMLHACLGASVFQPVAWHVKKAPPLNADRSHETPILSSSKNKETLVKSPSGSSFYDNGTLLTSQKGRSHYDFPEAASRTEGKRSSISSREEEEEEEEDLRVPLQGQYLHQPSSTETIKKTGLEEQLRYKTLSKGVLEFLKSILSDISLISTPKIFIMTIGSVCSASSCLNFIMLVPFAMQDAGHSLQSSASCISIFSITNLLAILTSSSLSDWKRFNIKFCYMAGHLLMASTILVFPLVIHDIPSIMVVMGLYGISLGSGIGVYNLVITSLLGADNLATVFGLSTFMVAIGSLVIGPLIGFIRDTCESYAVSMWVLSAIAAATVVLWLFMPAAIRYERKESAKNLQNESDIARRLA